jgi:hypothetical protein
LSLTSFDERRKLSNMTGTGNVCDLAKTVRLKVWSER